MRVQFDKQLETLNIELIKMGALCEDAISCAATYMLEGGKNLLEKVFQVDSAIDRKEREIETICMRLLLQQQPVAKDLRTVSSALKMISDMERIVILRIVSKSSVMSSNLRNSLLSLTATMPYEILSLRTVLIAR